MADFTLDDVRETYTADMTALLGRIQEAARSTLGAQALSLAVPRSEFGRTLFEDVEAHAHAIYGSSSLIALTSMSAPAKALEGLAHQGHRALLELERQVAEVRRISALCEEAAQALGVVLASELEGRTDAALEASRRLLPRLAAPGGGVALEPSPLPQPAPERREFSFDDEALDSAAEVRDELLEVFQQEAREYVIGLQGHLQTLGERPKDLSVAAQVERIYHTLKGSAATVGLSEVSAAAALLQAQFEELAEGTTSLSPPLLGEVVRQTNRLLRSASLPEMSLDLLKPTAPTAEGDRTRAYFVEEAQATCDEAAELIDATVGAGEDRREGLLLELSQLFHRLKGSALVLGDQSVADIAFRLQQECAQRGAVGELRTGLMHLRNLIHIDAAASSVASAAQQPSSEAPRPAASAVPPRQVELVTVSDDPELWDAFNQECRDLLEGMDKGLFALEQSAQPARELSALLRQAHTLKGAVNSVGLSPAGRLLHEVESFLEALLAGPSLPPMRELARVLLVVQQEVRLNLRQAPSGKVESSGATWAAWATERLRPQRREGLPVSGAVDRVSPPSEVDGSDGERSVIRVPTQRLDELMNLSGELVVSRSRLVNRVASLKALSRELGRSRGSLVARVEEFRQRYEYADLNGTRRRARGEVGAAAVAAPRSVAVAAVAGGSAPAPGAWASFSELELDRYEDVHILSRSLGELTDDLAEMDGQLVRELGEIAADSDGFSQLISRIQGEVTRARMVPVEALFNRLQLPVRDAAERAGREVRLKLEGAEVDLDKTIVDALLKPMLHLVRNAVHHGLEAAEERAQAQKPRQGVVTLRARQEAGQVVLEVQDDGRGLDLAALKARGVAAGRVGEDEPLGSPAIKELVFARGVSTSPEVSEVAGRGMGGDIVKRAIDRLNGEIKVETTAGKGTTFTITLPLTLLITQALLVRAGPRVLALPLFFAERIIELEEAAVTSLPSPQVKVQGAYLPLRRLEGLFGEPAELSRGPVVVLRLGEARLAVQVDQLLAREEIVVKGLGDVMQGHPTFAGVTMRGNGALVLVLDVPGLMEGLGPTSGRGRAPSPTAPSSGPTSSVADASTPRAVGGAPASAPPSAPARAPAPSAPVAPVAPPAAPKRRRVLVVDDSLSVRKVAEKVLVGLGVDVTLAVDGVDALGRLREQRFDLVFTDLEMPRLHGYELIREIRFLPALKGLPVVVISSRSGAKHQEQARALGASDYVTKPFSAQVLDAILKRHLGADPDTDGHG